MDLASTPPARRTGGRSARVRRSVLDAVLAIVADDGIDRLSVAAVAKRADVAETTVYRRWPTPSALLSDAVGDLVATGNPVPDTGSFRTDLRQLVLQVLELASQPALTRLLGAMAALGHDAEVADTRKQFWDQRFESSGAIVERAITKGELPTGTNSFDVLETASAPIYFRLLVIDRPIDHAFVDRCVDNVLRLYASDR